MDSLKKQARAAGFLYFLAGLPGPFGLIYVPNKLVATGDAAATANHLRASETLLRLGIASELLVAIMFIFVSLALYRLLRRVNENLAIAMVALLLVSVPVSFLNVLNDVAALAAARGAPFLSAFDRPQLDALAMFFLRLHGHGVLLAQVFWGLWLFPFGLLVIRSGFIPRVIGVLLILAGFGNVANSCAALFLPQYAALVSRWAMPLTAGELPIILWLMIWGAKEQRVTTPASQPAQGKTMSSTPTPSQ